MIKCCKCGHEGPRGVVVFTPSGDSREYCKVCRPSQHVNKAQNIWDNFTCQHMRDEKGKPIKVNSLKELREAEKRTNSVLAIMSDNDVSQPPQHEPDAGNIARKYKKKFNRDPAAYTAPKAKEGVSAGIARSAGDTLAYRPNPV
jgi:hypothetical protein